MKRLSSDPVVTLRLLGDTAAASRWAGLAKRLARQTYRSGIMKKSWSLGGGTGPPLWETGVGVTGEFTINDRHPADVTPDEIKKALFSDSGVGIDQSSVVVTVSGNSASRLEGSVSVQRSSIGTYRNAVGYGGGSSGVIISTGVASDFRTIREQGYHIRANSEQQGLLVPISGQSWHADVSQIDVLFNMLPGFDRVYFNIVFWSKEFPFYVGSAYNDAFGLYLNGVNIAFLAGYPVNIDHPYMGPDKTSPSWLAYGDGGILGSSPPGTGNPAEPPLFHTFVGNAQATNNKLTFIIGDSGDSSLDSYALISQLGGSAPSVVAAAGSGKAFLSVENFFNTQLSRATITASARTSRIAAQFASFESAIVRYTWGSASGVDLDIVTYIEIPDYIADAVGWVTSNQYTPSSETDLNASYLFWNKDTVSETGPEAILVNFKKLVDAYPSVNGFKILLYANWYEQKGDGRVTLSFDTYIGGAFDTTSVPYDITNTGGVLVETITKSVVVELLERSANPGQLIGTLTYNRTTNVFSLV
jgi:hypothetical protein